MARSCHFKLPQVTGIGQPLVEKRHIVSVARLPAGTEETITSQPRPADHLQL
jgi:hypothetical protein